MLFFEKEGWDSWLYQDPETGAFYVYYISGLNDTRPSYRYWNHVSGAVSADGVHYSKIGPVLDIPSPEVAWIGSGSTWPLMNASTGEPSDPPTYVLQYSGALPINETWSGHLGYQRIYFAISHDLVSWTPYDKPFDIDQRYYNRTIPQKRWDCMSVVCQNPAKSLHQCRSGYYATFTATPNGESENGFGLAQSSDGLHWEALPPITQCTKHSRWPNAPCLPGPSPEVGSFVYHSGNYFIVVSGAVYRAKNVTGPYSLVDANSMIYNSGGDANLCGRGENSTSGGSCFSFPRMWKTSAGDGILLMTATRVIGGSDAAGRPIAYFDTIKRVDVDSNGTARAAWWPGNEAIKGRGLAQKVALSPSIGLTSFSRPQWSLQQGLVVELHISQSLLSFDSCIGFVVEAIEESGDAWVACWNTTSGVGQVGSASLRDDNTYEWRASGTPGPGQSPTVIEHNLPIKSGVDLDFRLLLRADRYGPTMADVYIEDYLLAVWTLSNSSGRVGVAGVNGAKSVSPCSDCSASAMSLLGWQFGFPE